MKTIKISLKIFILMTITTGIIYPLIITGFAQFFYPQKANGSMILKNNVPIASVLIGQKFFSPKYFWGRSSAIDNNPMPSGGSNLNPLSHEFKLQFQARIDTIRKYHGNVQLNDIPKDLLFASASGVDPHISPMAALFQVDRIIKSRNLGANARGKIMALITSLTEPSDLGFLGEERININLLNIELDKLN